jgi:uncharacterized protein involved in response to NO
MIKRDINQRLPTQPTRFDLAVLVTTAIALLAWTAGPDRSPAAVLLIAAGLMQAIRLSRWGGARTVADPLVLILHIGYAWLPVGLLLLGAGIFDAGIPRTAGIHALTAGAMPTMILAVMTRAVLGHSGHPLSADAPTIVIYALITLGAVLRVATPFGLLDPAMGIEVAASAWSSAFILFLVAYGPILFQPALKKE